MGEGGELCILAISIFNGGNVCWFPTTLHACELPEFATWTTREALKVCEVIMQIGAKPRRRRYRAGSDLGIDVIQSGEAVDDQ